MHDVTQILNQIEAGDPFAADKLLPLVYEELRKLAAVRLAHENPGQTLQATALVHEAYLRLVGSNSEQTFDHRGHFFAAAAEAMRRILVEKARHKQSLKAGGQQKRVELARIDDDNKGPGPDILALNEALERLEIQDPRAAELVKLRFFVGMTIQETAEVLGVSAATAKKDWAYAKTWLRAEMLDQPQNDPAD